jgi:hypothetical protein
MLLPILLLLASSASVQPVQAGTNSGAAVSAADKSSKASNPDKTGQDGFVRKFPDRRQIPDEDIIQRHDCASGQECKTACLSITAYVFSDGENPQLKYVTYCPNLDVPNWTERAQRKGTGNDQQPTLRRTN